MKHTIWDANKCVLLTIEKAMQKILSTDGMTLIELVTVIVIIGFLIGIAVSRYNTYVAQARRAEAKTNLGTLWGLAETYKLEHGSVASDGFPVGGAGEHCDGTNKKNHIGFRPTNCNKLRYLYEHRTSGGSHIGWRAWAKATNKNNNIYPGCTGTAANKIGSDVVDINQSTKEITIPYANQDAIKTCE